MQGVRPPLPRDGAARVRVLLRPARSRVRLRGHPPARQPRGHRERPARAVALQGLPAGAGRGSAGGHRRWLDAAGARQEPGRVAGPAQPVPQERLRQSDVFLQGPAGDRGLHQGAGDRLRGAELRFDRQPGRRCGPHAARAGIKSYIFIPANLEMGKVVGAAIYDPVLVAVDGNYDQVNRLCSEIADRYRWAFVNINMRPYYAEGSKTLAYEVAEQLGWRAPDHVVVPVASGSMFTKIWKGFQEFATVGLIPERLPRMSVAQALGCSPVATAYFNDTLNVRPVIPDTIAKSLAIGNPADGYYDLKIIKQSGGAAEVATDQEIVDGIKLLAQTEGIFAETAGGVTIACLKKLVESGKIDPDELTVAYITGNGLKTQEAVADQLAPSMCVGPTLTSFEEALAAREPQLVVA